MMTLYAKGSLTTMIDTINVFDLGSSPMVTGRVVILKGEVESPMNPVSVDVIGRSEVWASGIPRTSATNQRTNWVRGSSLPCVRPRSDADVGLGWELTRKLSLNSFAKESKEKWMTA
ncbi:hypothetical protein BHE74_00028991 [Ensete ventricosum]|nr:hypothetical protein BHE74_00028991 [Ensete ventricosum]